MCFGYHPPPRVALSLAKRHAGERACQASFLIPNPKFPTRRSVARFPMSRHNFNALGPIFIMPRRHQFLPLDGAVVAFRDAHLVLDVVVMSFAHHHPTLNFLAMTTAN